MKRKLVLAAALCLAAALSIGAAPALAADGCDCHTVEPLSATAAHAPFVVSVADCTVCHTDWTVPHPDVGPPALWLSGKSTAAGYELSPRLGVMSFVGPGPGWVGHSGVVVYLQQRLWGATEFTDLSQVTTDSGGGATFTVTSPVPFAAYRAVAQGHVGALIAGGTRLFEPTLRELLPAPTVTLEKTSLPEAREGEARQDRQGSRQGEACRPWRKGHIPRPEAPPREVGDAPTIAGDAAIRATGSFSWKFTPKSRGLWRVRADTDAHSDTTSWGSSPWRKVRVR